MPKITMIKLKKTGLYNFVKSLNRANNVSVRGIESMVLFSTFH